MGRPKGSKNKNAVEEKGNPEFKIAAGAITDEDLALDRELEAMSRNTEPDVSDKDVIPEMRKSIEPYTLLSSIVENYKPASTIHELDQQVFDAKSAEVDSVEATPAIVKYFCKKSYPDKVGYFMYKDIKVYIDGFFEQSVSRDKETVEYRNFGASKIV